AHDPPGSPPTRPQPRRKSATIGKVHVGQIVCWELAVALIAAVIGRPASVVIPVAITAAFVLGITTVRVDQRWVYQWIGLYLRYLGRRRRWRLAPDGCRGSTLLGSVARGASTEVFDLDGTAVALICHAGGITAILEPLPIESGLIVDSGRPLPAPTALLPTGEEGEPPIAAQVVVHTAPAPALQADTNAAGTSYRYLGRGLVPAQRRCLIALQALRTADGHSDDELRAALASAVRRLQRRLRKDGMRVRVLDRADALTALLALARLDVPPSGPDVAPAPSFDEIHERWSHWSTGREVQTAFRLSEWPDLADPVGREFIDRMAGVSSLATTVALSARRHGEEVEVEAVVRLTLPRVSAVEPASDQVAAAAQLCGARLERLDGEQVFGVAASLPLGGFLP
ncbi:MAG TPA: type VII secretion protein EccE, partial [Cryptosporangiaceae bacterium]|nr:type VII secretion protein EccE [Cryptosporangiaceae bacterium]